MSQSNGVIRIGRKGLKKFAFGEDGEPFEIDVVVAFQEWVAIDDQFRVRTDDRSISNEDLPTFHKEAVRFAITTCNKGTRGGVSAADTNRITVAEALDFIARLREAYDEVAVFFRPKSREERESPGTSGSELQFSEEES